jgi:thioredoxin-like negative regulator of GroEL
MFYVYSIMKFIVVKPGDPSSARAFEEESARRPSFVRFHSPGCHHCEAMHGEYHALKDSETLGDVNVVDVDIGSLGDLDLPCAKHARGQPVPLMLAVDKKGNPLKEYDGARKRGDMEDFILTEVRSMSGGSRKRKGTKKSATMKRRTKARRGDSKKNGSRAKRSRAKRSRAKRSRAKRSRAKRSRTRRS